MPIRRGPPPLAIVLAAGVIAAAIGGCSPSRHHRATAAVTPTSSTAVPPLPPSSTTTTGAPVALDADVATLPEGAGHRIAIVVDDVGLADDFLEGYLSLPVPVTLAVMPFAPHAAEDDARIHEAGRDVILHIPLALRAGDRVTGGLRATATPADVDAYLSAALARVPHAVGASNHQGSYGPTVASSMDALLRGLQSRNLFFLDSVTTQRTVGYATARRLGLPPRINNVFMDHFETDADSRSALLELARIAAAQGAAIGICHVFHPYELHALQATAAQLEARGYVFAPLSAVTNAPAPAGLDRGVRS